MLSSGSDRLMIVEIGGSQSVCSGMGCLGAGYENRKSVPDLSIKRRQRSPPIEEPANVQGSVRQGSRIARFEVIRSRSRDNTEPAHDVRIQSETTSQAPSSWAKLILRSSSSSAPRRLGADQETMTDDLEVIPLGLYPNARQPLRTEPREQQGMTLTPGDQAA